MLVILGNSLYETKDYPNEVLDVFGVFSSIESPDSVGIAR